MKNTKLKRELNLIKKVNNQMIEEHRAQVARRYEKVDAILRAVDKNQQFEKLTSLSDGKEQVVEYEFAGQIGPDVTFTKNSRRVLGNHRTTRKAVNVHLMCQGEELGRIFVKNDFSRYGSFQGHENQIMVLSPKFKDGESTMPDVSKLPKRKAVLKVYSGEDETADAVIDRMSGAIAKSLDKVLLAKKLSKLNLPSQVTIKNQDTLADNIMEQIYRTDREM